MPSRPPFPSKRVHQKLQRWYKRHARDLPWRGDTDPYRIWVSEIMLVQTTVAVAIKRYPRFLKRFPTLYALAKASLNQVMKEWEGLGYYNRARFLHRSARIIRDRYDGRFPEDYDSIRALPGVGVYVAAAILNFCFGGHNPPIDANVARLGARLFGIRGDVRSGKVRSRIESRLMELMNVGRGAFWTDALIELGALVCTPRSPDCVNCPLRSDCVAYARGRPAAYGLPTTQIVQREVQVACGIVRRRDGRILIALRPEGGLLAGLWEFPGGKRRGNERLVDTCRREIREELGINVTVGSKRQVIRHGYSHYNVRLHVFECRYRSGRPRPIGCRAFRWVRPKDLRRYAFPSANTVIIRDLLSEDNASS